MFLCPLSQYTKEAVLQQEHEQLLRRGRQSDTSQSDVESSPIRGLPPSPSPAGRPNYGDSNGYSNGNRARSRSRSRDARIYKYSEQQQQEQQDQYSDHTASSQLSGEVEDSSPNGHKSLESITTTTDHAGHYSAAAAADSTVDSSTYDSFSSSTSFHSFPTAYIYSPSPPPAQDLITLDPTPPSLNAHFPAIFGSDGTCTASSIAVQTQNMVAVKATTWSEMFFWMLVYALLGSGFAVLVWDGVCGLVEVVGEWAWGVLCRFLMELGV